MQPAVPPPPPSRRTVYFVCSESEGFESAVEDEDEEDDYEPTPVKPKASKAKASKAQASKPKGKAAAAASKPAAAASRKAAAGAKGGARGKVRHDAIRLQSRFLRSGELCDKDECLRTVCNVCRLQVCTLASAWCCRLKTVCRSRKAAGCGVSRRVCRHVRLR